MEVPIAVGCAFLETLAKRVYHHPFNQEQMVWNSDITVGRRRRPHSRGGRSTDSVINRKHCGGPAWIRQNGAIRSTENHEKNHNTVYHEAAPTRTSCAVINLPPRRQGVMAKSTL
uniref:Fork-head domain-containing protein n=1 Tax=Trichuris muris TaxID=70415 RepID=A0A5S6QBU3_TRIMR